ncbi:MAG: GerMN domain-containing protein [Acidobacteriota bacterium]
MSWRWALAAIALLIGACGGSDAPLDEVTDAPVAVASGAASSLYFPGPGGRLFPEERELDLAGEPEARIRTLLAALLGGPEQDGHLPVFDFAVAVAGVYLTVDGVAFVDLEPAEEGELEPAAGSHQEIQTVYSLVNTIALNVPEARRVVLLWEGQQGLTFSGHLDTSRPLGAAPDLIERQP